MARRTKRLSARTVASLAKPGRHADGEGLYLVVDPSGAKRWLFLFRWRGKLKEMGLGGLASVSLAEARERADEARRILASGENPIEVRKAEKAEREAALTFGPFADALAADLSQGFRSAKHQADWSRTLKTFAEPLRGKRLDDIHTDDVLAVLTPIWQTKHETASRLRGRIERVLDAARAKGLRSGENPARWRGHLDHLIMPKRLKVAQPHHAAMPYSDVPALMKQLRAYNGVASRALEFLILTAGRTSEVWRPVGMKSTWPRRSGRCRRNA